MAGGSPKLGPGEDGEGEPRPSLVPIEAPVLDGTLEPVLDDVTESELFSHPPSPSGAEPSRSGQVLAQGYVIQRLLAKGAMGTVYLATQTPPGREVAVKCVDPRPHDPGFKQRFAAEAALAARLTHRHIVTVHDYGVTDAGELFLTMEFLRGEPLSRLIQREARVASDRVARIGLQVSRALRHAHRQGVVHRDLVPGNVMLLHDEDHDVGDFIKVLDFGLVKAFQTGDDAGTWNGAPRYMSPEQIRRKDVDFRSDIYSLGAILFHLLAGRPPFIGATSVEIFSQHLRDPVPWVRDVSGVSDVAPELEVVVRRCLEKDPARRYQSMDDLIADLKAALRLIEGTMGFGEPLSAGNFFDPSESSLSGTISLPPPRPVRTAGLPTLDALAAEAGLDDSDPLAELASGRPSPIAPLAAPMAQVSDLVEPAAPAPVAPTPSRSVPPLAPPSNRPSPAPAPEPQAPPARPSIPLEAELAAAFQASPPSMDLPSPRGVPSLLPPEDAAPQRSAAPWIVIVLVAIGAVGAYLALGGRAEPPSPPPASAAPSPSSVGASPSPSPAPASAAPTAPVAAPSPTAAPASGRPKRSPTPSTEPSPVAERGREPDAPQPVPDSVIPELPEVMLPAVGDAPKPSRPPTAPVDEEPRVGGR